MSSQNLKRSSDSSGSSQFEDRNTDTKRIKVASCQYGEKCFRKNPQHFQEYSHPHLNFLVNLYGNDKLPVSFPAKINVNILQEQLEIVKSLKVISTNDKIQPSSNDATLNSSPKPNPINLDEFVHPSWRLNRGKVKGKVANSKPYRLFLTAIKDEPKTHSESLSLSFQEILDSSLGVIKESLQINFMVELPWLLAQYHITGNRGKPITIIHGEDDNIKEGRHLPHITTALVKSPIPFGHHHTKMMIFLYSDDSIRVVMSTANLIESDWENRVQGIWIGPKCRKLPYGSDTTAGDSVTKFKRNLLQYLSFYKLSKLEEWVDRVRRADFSKIRVFFTSSVPGSHNGPSRDMWGHLQIGKILKENPPESFSEDAHKQWSVIVQCSSIGSLGKSCTDWLCSEILSSFSRGVPSFNYPDVNVIYPSFKNVENSHDGLLGGGCLPYTKKVHQNQLWLDDKLYQWKSQSRFRTKAMPHIKSYCCVSPNHQSASWFLLTSANLSKAAFGAKTKKDGSLMIRSFEAGILFLPQYLINEDTLPLPGSKVNDKLIFQLPFDLPLKKYSSDDTVWDYGIYRE